MSLSIPFGNGRAAGDLQADAVATPDRACDHRIGGPARFWADPPPGHIRIAA